MADLRAGSTVGGRPIATSDMLENIVSKEQISQWSNKMNKFENNITDANYVDSIFFDKNKNGIYQINNVALGTNMYQWGTLFNITGSNYGLQIYSPEIAGSSGNEGYASMYFRTRNTTDKRPWKRVATYDYVDSGLKTKFNTTGGTISGNVNIQNNAPVLGIKNTKDNDVSLVFDRGNNANWRILSSSGKLFFQNDYTTAKTNYYNVLTLEYNSKAVRCDGELYALKDKKVYHTGNLNPSSYIQHSNVLAAGTDLNNLTSEGIYRISKAINKPANVNDWGYYIVISHGTDWILQIAYAFNLNKPVYHRVKENKVWTAWIPSGGTKSFVKTIATTSEWKQDTVAGSATNGMYYLTVTHNLGYTNIISAVLTNASNVSMATGFEVIDKNKTKIWCSTNPTGKIVINASI